MKKIEIIMALMVLLSTGFAFAGSELCDPTGAGTCDETGCDDIFLHSTSGWSLIVGTRCRDATTGYWIYNETDSSPNYVPIIVNTDTYWVEYQEGGYLIQCPSYEMMGNVAVTAANCGCGFEGTPCPDDATIATIMNFDDPFFAGSSGPEGDAVPETGSSSLVTVGLLVAVAAAIGVVLFKKK